MVERDPLLLLTLNFEVLGAFKLKLSIFAVNGSSFARFNSHEDRPRSPLVKTKTG